MMKASKLNPSLAVVAKPIVGLHGAGLLCMGDTTKLELRHRLAMTREVFARFARVSERTIADAEGGKNASEELVQSYNEVYRLYEALTEVVNPDCLGDWFQTPNDSFDGMVPVDVVEHGNINRLWSMVFRLQTGMPG
jgi:DNA-binding XRE family transcriptional regulator